MSFVFKINEELAAVTVTATELLSVSRTISGLIKDDEFTPLFKDIIAEVNQSYGVLLDSFRPFYELDSEERFASEFPRVFAAFKENYLWEVSKPRKYCDNVYDAYIQMQQTRAAKTGFPLLKRNFSRLDVLYDKWITNDALLAMSIDGAIKLKNRLLSEIDDISKKDMEEAYAVFSSAFDDFQAYFDLIQNKSRHIASIVEA